MEKESQNTQNQITQQAKPQDFLATALQNAELLLNYSAQKGLKIKEEWINTIIAARKAERGSAWTTELEINFWIAYKNLSALVRPVSIESLKASNKQEYQDPNYFHKLFNIKHRKASATISVRNYLIAALFFIVILLVIQVFSLKGTTLLNSIINNNQRISQIEKRKRELKLILKSDANNERAKLERYALESENVRLDREKSSSIELLKPWVLTVRNIISFGQNTVPEYLKEKPEESKKPQGPGFGPPGQGSPDNDMNIKISIVQEANNFTQIIQLYILPLLYGLIGGFVFVLRGLSYDITHHVFSTNSNIKYSLRISLGALSGIIVGLLWSDIEGTQITFLESFSTGAIAFIAGYGVEYVFNALDNFINNISGTQDAN